MRGLRAALVIGLVLAGGSSTLAGCSSDGQAEVDGTPSDVVTASVPRFTVEVLASHPHDPEAFTEGLVVSDDGRLFESTGGYGTSQVREVDLETGAVLRHADLAADLFGEGLAISGDELVQLTWKEGVALRWGIDDFVERGRDDYEGEGWGLARDGDDLFQSDGSPTVTVRDRATFAPRRTFDVTSAEEPVEELNELEVVDGLLYANVWHTEQIVMADLTGRVTGLIDASALTPAGLSDPEAVLNGIAHRPGDPADRLLLTGKRWPVLYEVRIVPK
jgi:glutamine cyclotransferase